MKTDDKIQKEVIEEIHRDLQLRKIAAEIGVTVKNEVVTLFGKVDQRLKNAAEQAARRIKGVNIVVSDITVKSPGNFKIWGDAEVGEAIHDLIKEHNEINPSFVVSVDHGWIFLKGLVDHPSEKLAITRLIELIPGVNKVINQIKVKNLISNSGETEKIIVKELERYPYLDSDNIKVKVNNGLVMLSGEVQSWKDVEDAEIIVSSLPGVSEVVNQLTVDCEIYAT